MPASKDGRPEPQSGNGDEESANQGKVSRPSAVALKIRDQFQRYRERTKDAEYRKERRERWTIAGLFVAAGLALLQWRELRSTDHNIAEQARISAGQWKVMQDQLNEMKSGSGQVERSIEASNRIADESKAANTMTGEANRPWIGAVVVTVVPPIFEMKASTVTINLSNSGKSPAYVLKTRCGVAILPTAPTDPPYTLTAAQTEIASKSIMVPGQQFACPMRAPPIPALELGRIKLSAGPYSFYVYGEVIYRDVATQAEHKTRVCWLYNASVDAYIFCSTYNSAD